MMEGVFNYNQAISQCNKVLQARDFCSDARVAVRGSIVSVSDNWRGCSGEAMLAALEEQERNLNTIISKINTLHANMRHKASYYQEIGTVER